MALLDVARGDDRHTAERLTAEPVIWLGTVRPDGRPHHVPIWFVWHDPLVLLIHVQRITAGTGTATGVTYRVVP
jgi:predicted pyridoxine 5'-phosphate oxidase superfamily flavin-nucleotide-binding protein